MAVEQPRATYYTLADESYFAGLVALLNSLRLTGNQGELVVLDGGLTDQQRHTLEAHATLVRLPPAVAQRTVLAKPYIHRLEPAGVVMWLDSDIIVTRSLDRQASLAGEGHLCVYRDGLTGDRYFPEWEELFDLPAPPRRQPYGNGGFMAMSVSHWPELLDLWWRACERIPPERVFGPHEDPIALGDQDTLNAVLMSYVSEGALISEHEDEMVFPAHMDELVIDDLDTLGCSHLGRPVGMFHHGWFPKPWTRPGRALVGRNVYLELLQRSLFADDVAVRLDPHEVPPWLRPGTAGRTWMSAVQLERRAKWWARRGRAALRRA